MLTKNESFLLCLLAATLILPANIYLIGEEGLGAGLQTSFLRYQQTHLGTSVITLADDLGYVTSGIIGGRSALSILLWAFGTSFLLVAVGYLIYNRYNGVTGIRRPLALLTAGGAGAYLLSCIAQYGPTLHGSAGFSIPVGVPLILAVAAYILKAEGMDDELEYAEEGEDDGEGIEEEE
ncbi:hypothetical protein ACK11Z_12550 [Methanoculleus bourgensis]|uniref:hypothetical protein n=1 Tax=Methanoculleus bourgensis TaxID=83986 RepID=UPI003B923305